MEIENIFAKFPKKFRKNAFERASWSNNQSVCGIDEVGRGCLAGPVVTAAVIIPMRQICPLLQDSKVLSPEKRLKAFRWLIKRSEYSYSIVHHRHIDTVNIYQATRIAMKRAAIQLFEKCTQLPIITLVDAVPLDFSNSSYRNMLLRHFPFGESKSISIAAASIIAKVTRDRIMEAMDPLFPGYALAQHKGYATKDHKQLIWDHGHSIIHRISFLQKFYLGKLNEPTNNQQTLF